MYDALRVSLTDMKCLPRKRDATTWAALLNLFGRDRPSFQSADIKLRLTRYLEVLGRTRGVRPHSNRLRPRNRGRAFSEKVLIRVTNSTLPPGMVKPMGDFPCEQPTVAIAAEAELAPRLCCEQQGYVNVRHVFDDQLGACVTIAYSIDQIHRLIMIEQSGEL